MTMDPATREQLEKYGCFCGGHGWYTNYNCGEALDVRCPHCRGSGKRQPTCKCEAASLLCGQDQ